MQAVDLLLSKQKVKSSVLWVSREREQQTEA